MITLKRFLRCDSGATAIEYGLICTLMVVAIIAALQNFGDANENVYNTVTNNVQPVLS